MIGQPENDNELLATQVTAVGAPTYPIFTATTNLFSGDDTHQGRVRKMMVGFGQHVRFAPAVPSAEEIERMIRVDLEEVLEFIEACGYQLEPPYDSCVMHKHNYYLNRVCDPDLVAMADAIADKSVTNTCCACACGIDMAPLLEEVDGNNLTKIANGRLNPDTGKFEKPEGHIGPNIRGVLQRQGWEG